MKLVETPPDTFTQVGMDESQAIFIILTQQMSKQFDAVGKNVNCMHLIRPADIKL